MRGLRISCKSGKLEIWPSHEGWDELATSIYLPGEQTIFNSKPIADYKKTIDDALGSLPCRRFASYWKQAVMLCFSMPALLALGVDENFYSAHLIPVSERRVENSPAFQRRVQAAKPPKSRRDG